METAINSPLTDKQLTDKQVSKLEAGGVIATPASWGDFMEFLHETRYRVPTVGSAEYLEFNGLRKLG